VIGRDPAVDVTVAHNRVSRHHLRVVFDEGQWILEDLASANGTFHNGIVMTQLPITENTVVNVGAKTGPAISFTLVMSTSEGIAQPDTKIAGDETTFTRLDDLPSTEVLPSLTNPTALTRRVVLKQRTTIGRDATNDIEVKDDLLVSRFHAELTQHRDGYFEVVDLNSANGTFVNGKRTKRSRLDVGDTLAIGSSVLQYVRGALEPLGQEGGFSFTARSIDLTIGGKKLLRDVSFDLKPRSLTAIVGPSGSGKSTLLSVLSGQRRPTKGSVEFAGRDLFGSYEELRNRIGLVPQADLLHTTLKTRKALEYGAALRLPRDTTSVERIERVDQVLKDLGLSARADLRIDKLSGGQKKRTSVALELLTNPELLFLDEPTSGLDPGLDRQVMNLLRELADAGRTVVIVTHSTANLDVCDDIVVMAAGGSLGYFGSPFSVLSSFKADDWADVFEALEGGALAHNHTTAETAVTANTTPATFAKKRQQSWLFQFFQLQKRYVEVIASDKAYLGLMLSLPVIIGLVALMTGSDYGLGPGDEDSFFLNIEARSTLLILLLGSIFMGAASSIQEIVKERVIYNRERSTGLSRSAYVLSKFGVLAVIALFQATIFTVVALAGKERPEDALYFGGVLTDVLFVVAVLTLASSAIGLLISAIANSTEVAMPGLVVITMVQVVFSGAVPLINDTILNVFGWLNPAYWAMNALSASIDLNELLGHTGESVLSRWDATPSAYESGALGVLVFLVLALLATTVTMAIRERADR
jgi:ABC transport system ATP-binding/permease protein